MKILVDSTPASTQECPFANFKKSKINDSHMCQIGYLVCRAGEVDFECPFFVGMREVNYSG